MGDEIGADPPDNPRIDISDLKQGRHVRVSGPAINVDHVCHPPVIGISASADDRHARFHRQEHRRKLPRQALERDNAMIN